ncbi:hypothetical protein EI546_10740 [Aequorivita sp. H23M31]|uniref:Uncharacterized protein n=1 Tax=Aequorivita ciconiae TaxID=2494375 RepID=A0A410G4H7_9FLAO|nr:hypothetical protein [Aequorivita sp. H23M31]QAA82170.1 hypothetical protein EI546_10740 [Aequorivita sp. H23M31]
MKIDATLIGVIILLLIFVPIIYMIVNASGVNKKVTKSVLQLAQGKGLHLENVDVIGNLVIGMDRNSRKLIYSTKRNPQNDFKVINLEDVKDCRAKSIKVSDKTLQWVGLELVEKQGKKEIQFYCENDESGLTKDPYVCLQDAKRWENEVRPLLLKAS